MQSTPHSDPRSRLGSAAEKATKQHLENGGWRILAQNVRWREGEIDLIGLDGNALVFVEVKSLRARDGMAPFSPFESINVRKQQRIRSLARRWLIDELPRLRGDQNVVISDIRFDAVAVTMGPGNCVLELEHLSDAF